ncbi:MAG: hypothetical protein ACO3MW_03425 [Rhodospirillales bacterium]|jgi:hypothetical protein
MFRRLCAAYVLSVFMIGVARAEHVEGVPHAKPGEKAVFMVLLPNTDMAHASEMPSMERCLAAIQYLSRAICVEAIIPPSGDWPDKILNMIPPPDDVPD